MLILIFFIVIQIFYEAALFLDLEQKELRVRCS